MLIENALYVVLKNNSYSFIHKKSNFRGNFILLIFLCLSTSSISQNYHWWNVKHNWNGITPWYDYMITTPAYMGPNALPVPIINSGIIPEEFILKLSVDNHFSKGDKTENLYTEIYLPLAKNRVGLMLQLVPIEHFKMDTLTRDKRYARGISGEGYAAGDVYIGTYIQILQNLGNWPDVLLTINLKTSSGNNLANARYTDTPGYFFDLSAGKDFFVNRSHIEYIRLYALAGFYVWQMQGNGQFQDDAFLYGGGVNIRLPKWEIKNSLGGYVGYLDRGDKPMVYRLQCVSRFNSTVNYELAFQQGLHDFGYTSFRISALFHFSLPDKLFQH